MRRARVRATRGHHRGEAEDGDDCVRLLDGDGLHPQYGLREAAEQRCEQYCEQQSIMSRRVAIRPREGFSLGMCARGDGLSHDFCEPCLFNGRNYCIYTHTHTHTHT